MKLKCKDCDMGPCELTVSNCSDRTSFMGCPAAHDNGMDCGVTWEIVE